LSVILIEMSETSWLGENAVEAVEINPAVEMAISTTLKHTSTTNRSEKSDDTVLSPCPYIFGRPSMSVYVRVPSLHSTSKAITKYCRYDEHSDWQKVQDLPVHP